jgi:tRNA U34 2-thiouridine synthase MnmA/TrmU
MKEFLAHYIEPKRGDVLNEEGKIIGFHDGALFHTLGERHGFTITEKTPDDKPYYVIAKNITTNTITVSQNPKNQTLSKEVSLQIVYGDFHRSKSSLLERVPREAGGCVLKFAITVN